MLRMNVRNKCGECQEWMLGMLGMLGSFDRCKYMNVCIIKFMYVCRCKIFPVLRSWEW